MSIAQLARISCCYRLCIERRGALGGAFRARSRMARTPSVEEHQPAVSMVAVSDASVFAFRRYSFLDSDLTSYSYLRSSIRR